MEMPKSEVTELLQQVAAILQKLSDMEEKEPEKKTTHPVSKGHEALWLTAMMMIGGGINLLTTLHHQAFN